jgi:hypothetical protein
MPKYLPGATHSIVRTVHNIQDMQLMNGIMALIDVCFGPGDADAVRMIAIKKMEGPTSGATAHIPRTVIVREGKRGWVPVLEGKVADEAKTIALVAFDKVKSKFGLKFNKTYKVFAKDIEEVDSFEAR